MGLALVTGGCRRIGAAIARRLARDGHDLALHAHEAGTAPEPELAATLAEAGVAWDVFQADLAVAAEVEALVPAVTARFGRAPDILVNSASRFGPGTPETAAIADLTGYHAVNVAAPAVLARGVAAAGVPAAIVNILDQRIVHPPADQLGYTLSKLSLRDLTLILARHLAPAVRVNAVAPGLTLPTGDYAEGQMARLAGAMPLERLATPEEIADAVGWLVAAPSVTGQVIFVDGGAHLERYARDFLYM